MKALILKDFFNLRDNLKQGIFLILIFSAISIYNKNPIFIVSILTMLSLSFSLSSFVYDEKSDFYAYALSLPISRKSLVISRYLTGLIILILSGCLAGIVYLILSLLKLQVDGMEFLISSLAIASVVVIFMAILFPVSFKYNVERARYVSLGLFGIPFFLGLILRRPLANYLKNIKDLEGLILFGLKLLPLVLIIFLAISIFLSIKFFQAKDL